MPKSLEVRAMAAMIYMGFIVVVSVLLSWAVALLLLVFQQEKLGRLEGELMPVVSNVEVVDSRPGNCANCTDIIFEFVKRRSCEPKQVVVFRQDQDGAILRIPSRFLNDFRGDLITRPVGFNRTGWFRVEDKYEYSGQQEYEVRVWHDCHAFFYTETIMYVGPLRENLQR